MATLLPPSFSSSLSLRYPPHLHEQPAHVDPDRHVVHQLLEHLPLRGPAVGRGAPRRRERRQGGPELGDLAAGLGGALGAVLLVGGSMVGAAASGRRREGAAVSRRRRHRSKRPKNGRSKKSEGKNLFSISLVPRSSPLLPFSLSARLHPSAMDARAACLRSRSISAASSNRNNRSSSSSSRRSRVNTAAGAPRAATPIRRRPSVAATAANRDDENLDLDFLLAPPDIDGDVAAAYADAGARFDVRS